MKFRLGALSGTPGDGADTSGVYFALSDAREDVVAIRGIYYGKVKIWPGEGLHRITALHLKVAPEISRLINKYKGASHDFRAGEAYLRLQTGERVWRRDATHAQIEWDSNGQKLLFLNNNGPWADAILRGDYITLEFGMQAYTDTIQPEDTYPKLTQVALFEPVTTCDIVISANWDSGNAGAVAVAAADGSIMSTAEAYKWFGKRRKGGGGYWHYSGQSRTLRAVAHGGTIWMKGIRSTRAATVSYPAASGSAGLMVLNVEVSS